jgi:tRNA dimethylallyltransferase
MATRPKDLPLIVIVGPTASGKTALAVKLAEQLSGEIICADSRTVYKGMDIGTAKPSVAERARVPHWGLDLVEPDRPFSVSDFKDYADAKIAEIRKRGKIPFLVGGSGLYIDAVIFNYQFGKKATAEKRAALEKLSLDDLYKYCKDNDIPLPENSKNKRYIVRSIERGTYTAKRRGVPISSTIIVGIATDRVILRQRIATRSEQLFEQGVVEEAIVLGKKYGWEYESMTGNIYPLLRSYLEGVGDAEEAKKRFTTLEWRLAKRQLTWFRSNPHIIWLTHDGTTSHIIGVLADMLES